MLLLPCNALNWKSEELTIFGLVFVNVSELQIWTWNILILIFRAIVKGYNLLTSLFCFRLFVPLPYVIVIFVVQCLRR
jgi:hypothetical protein